MIIIWDPTVSDSAAVAAGASPFRARLHGRGETEQVYCIILNHIRLHYITCCYIIIYYNVQYII